MLLNRMGYYFFIFVSLILLVSCESNEIENIQDISENKLELNEGTNYIISVNDFNTNSTKFFVQNDKVKLINLENGIENMLPYYDKSNFFLQTRNELIDLNSDESYSTKNKTENFNMYPIIGKSEENFYTLFNEGYLDENEKYATGIRSFNDKEKNLNEFKIYYDIFIHSGDIFDHNAYVIGLDLSDPANKVIMGKIDLTKKTFEVLKEINNEQLANSEMNFLKYHQDNIMFVNSLGFFEIYSTEGEILKETKLKGEYKYSYSLNTPNIQNEKEFIYVGNKGSILKINKDDMSSNEINSELPSLKYEETYASLAADNDYLYFLNTQNYTIEKYNLNNGKYESEIPINANIVEEIDNNNMFIENFMVINK